jgi:hypothetical protein
MAGVFRGTRLYFGAVMAYRKGKQYFYNIMIRKIWGPSSWYDMTRRGTVTPLKDLTAEEMCDYLIGEAIQASDYKHLNLNEVMVASYHIEPN